MESSRDDDDIGQAIAKFSETKRRACSCGRSTLNFPTLLGLSFLFNIVFVVLFVVVFIRLENVQTRLANLENPVLGDPNKISGEQGIDNPRRANSTLSPFALNVTTTPILLKVRAISHLAQS